MCGVSRDRGALGRGIVLAMVRRALGGHRLRLAEGLRDARHLRSIQDCP
ncbi:MULTISPECIES: hypothetical protein [Amycolatopsis]|uniref:Uncharacterized protein n=1 Tax=Amycolatopsis albidoflavus TaxID=102226 RepID=A0ABW5HX54_9PSEU